MTLDASALWLIGAIIVLTWTALLVLGHRHACRGTWEQSVLRHHRWSAAGGPLALIGLVSYVTLSSVLLALIVCGLAQWLLASTQQDRRTAPRGSSRDAPGR